MLKGISTHVSLTIRLLKSSNEFFVYFFAINNPKLAVVISLNFYLTSACVKTLFQKLFVLVEGSEILIHLKIGLQSYRFHSKFLCTL